MRCVIGKFQSISGTPLKWQPYLSTSRACLQRSPPFAFRVTSKRWQGCVYGNVCMCECRCMTAILAVNPLIKNSTLTLKLLRLKQREHAALFFLWFFRFLQCTDCVLPGKLGEITSHLGAESPREQLKVSVCTHTRAHSPVFLGEMVLL